MLPGEGGPGKGANEAVNDLEVLCEKYKGADVVIPISKATSRMKILC